MKKLKTILVLLAVLSTVFTATAQNNERIQASYIVALGRLPNSGELSYWNSRGNLSVADMVKMHTDYIKIDAGTRRSVIVKSYIDALGYTPSEGEINYHSSFNKNYTDMVNSHIKYAVQNSSEHDKIIKRSYMKAFNRLPNNGELAYWKKFGVISYSYLVSMHEEYKRTNNSQGNGRLSVSSPSLSAVMVSASVLADTKLVVSGIVAAGGGNMVAAGGGNMVAAGGGNMVAAGGGNMVAAGGGNMVAAGGGNLTGVTGI